MCTRGRTPFLRLNFILHLLPIQTLLSQHLFPRPRRPERARLIRFHWRSSIQTTRIPFRRIQYQPRPFPLFPVGKPYPSSPSIGFLTRVAKP
ncbi:hypothetical protein ACJW30_05G053700 [Castanea mollissima]